MLINRLLHHRSAVHLPQERPAGGDIPAFQVYASGAVYHTSCAVQLILQASTDADFKQRTLAVLEGLAPNKVHRPQSAKSQNYIATAKSQMLAQLAAVLKQGDPLNSDCIVHLLSVPFAGSGTDKSADDWRMGSNCTSN